MKNVFIGIGLIVLSFVSANWIDNWYQVGDTIEGLKGWMFFHNSFLTLPPLLAGFVLLLWNTKLVQEPWFQQDATKETDI